MDIAHHEVLLGLESLYMFCAELTILWLAPLEQTRRSYSDFGGRRMLGGLLTESHGRPWQTCSSSSDVRFPPSTKRGTQLHDRFTSWCYV